MDIVALGEILIDFVEDSQSPGVLPAYIAQPGGAPANVLCSAAKFSKNCAFIGKVGQDKFGELLIHTLHQHNVDTSNVIESKEYNTTLAFVHVQKDGDRSFSFYRQGCADTKLQQNEIDSTLLKNCKVFHFGSNSFTSESMKQATLYAIEIAKQHGAIISYDPNIRVNLWQQPAQIKPAILDVLPDVHILKLSQEELLFITEIEDCEQAMNTLYAAYKTPLIVVTLGSEGAMYLYNNENRKVQGHPVEVVDTTGAGDCFVGTLLAHILEEQQPIQQLSHSAVELAVRVANTAAALSTTKKGAIPSLPTKLEVQQYIECTE